MGKRKAGKDKLRRSDPSGRCGSVSPLRRHRSRSRSRSPDHIKLQLKALKYISRGNARRLSKLLRRTEQPLDLAGGDSQGRTLLHHACACGHANVASLLLRYGAAASAVDASGDTAAHLAARGGHLEALAEALQAPGAPSLDVSGAGGETLRDLIAAAVRGSGAGGAGAARDSIGSHRTDYLSRQRRASEAGEHEDADEDEDARWRRRLREECSDGEGPSGGGWEGVEISAPFGTGEEDDDVWADRLWREMQSRRRAAAATSAAIFTTDLRAEAARKAAEAAERSQRILREEQAKDADWRRRALAAAETGQALVPVDLATARVAYDERWAQLDLETTGGVSAGDGGTQAQAQAPLSYWDIPWPLEMPAVQPAAGGRPTRPQQPPIPPPPPPLSADALRDFLLLGSSGPTDVKKRLRTELLRWHPDKFGVRFGARLTASGPGQRDAVLARVQQLAQVLTQVLGRRAGS